MSLLGVRGTAIAFARRGGGTMKNVPIYLALAALMSVPAHGGPSSSEPKDGCETVGRRVYDLCMAGPKADQETCIREYDEAYLRCKRGPTEPEPRPVDPKLSENAYRIPYADGTKVKISRDFGDHNLPGKIDMHGKGGGTYRIVAARAGTVRFIQDSRSKQQHPMRWLRNMTECNNNYVWIEHDNGEWSKYSHMQQWSTTGKARLKVGDKVEKGRYLGDEGKVGCAWPAHLHFEIVKKDENWKAAIGNKADGELADYDRVGQNRNPVIEGIPGRTFKDGETYVVNPPPTCKKDSDCEDGHYCDGGADFTKNACRPLKADNETCALVGGGHQCKSGNCRFSRCYTPDSVNIGGTCYSDDACRSGRCSDFDGARGECVCNGDEDCGSSSYCNKGLDLELNECLPKLNKGQKCGKALSVGNDHKCKSGKCSGFPKYECK
jgi:murein DD-endopeptidase MepM/ murein hydrolase activator NlpD